MLNTIKTKINNAWNWVKKWFKATKREIREDGFKSYLKKRWKKIVVTATGVALIAQVIPTSIPTDLQLPTTPDKILYSRTIKKEKCKKWKEIINGTSTQVCEQSEYEDVVEYIYASNIEVPKKKGEDISKRTKNAQIFPWSKDGIKYETKVVQIGEPFYKDTNGVWYETEEATTTPDAFNQQMGFNSLFGQKALAVTTTTYSGVGDGWISKGNSSVWATTRDAGTGQTANYTSTEGLDIATYWTSVYVISRGFYPFYTVIPVNTTIATSSLFLFPYNSAVVDQSVTTAEIVQTSQADHTQLATTDYDALTFTSGGSLAFSSWSIVAYNEIVLNATGRDWIKELGEAANCGAALTGWTCLGVITGEDLNDTPTGTDDNYVGNRFFEYAATTYDPYLEITYTFLEPPATYDLWIKGELQI